MIGISQSLIKEVQKYDYCPRQVFFSFYEGKELVDPSEPMILGRYFETELLGSCRGGEKQEARKLKNGTLSKPFIDCLEGVYFAKKTLRKIGLNIEDGKSQLRVKKDGLVASIDHRNKDISDPTKLANYDVKWTKTEADDRWRGWGLPEEKDDAIIQAVHYTYVSYLETGKWLPFYFLIFGFSKNKWVKILKYKFSDIIFENHKSLIIDTKNEIKTHQKTNFKGNGDFNKCISCLFLKECPDASKSPKIEQINIV